MKAIVDQDECIGCGVCIEMCPEVFTWNDDEKAVAYTNPVPEDVQQTCQEAADSCPSEAITIEA
jgi:ferredoxin